jgi:hypothetical protein
VSSRVPFALASLLYGLFLPRRETGSRRLRRTGLGARREGGGAQGAGAAAAAAGANRGDRDAGGTGTGTPLFKCLFPLRDPTLAPERSTGRGGRGGPGQEGTRLRECGRQGWSLGGCSPGKGLVGGGMTSE